MAPILPPAQPSDVLTAGWEAPLCSRLSPGVARYERHRTTDAYGTAVAEPLSIVP
jgi:hypothetical protein